MSERERHRLVEIVGQAMNLPRADRPAFLQDACPDSTMRDEALSLVTSLETAEGFMASPAMSERAVPDERPGAMIGRYRLLEQIGEGGFGLVFMAEQQEPVRRRVALKIIKLGMDTGRVIARFEAERQALAMMDHPNIARVLDAGATGTGRPYFVMDLVQGEPVTEFCDSHELSVAQRLELFVQVCRAVQHAHSKGIIHRDLKPGNVLVAERDSRAEAKVIDFGIAKAIDRPLTERTLFTEFRQFIGTPEYMSPEQAGGSPDVDTRTDVYALGVMLYELLTGTPPLDRQRLRSAAFDEMQRLIREEDAPAPSTRLSKSGSALVRLAAQRHTEPSQLGTLVRGELDWIVMRSLEKDRVRRYESPGDFARDVERFLAGAPVEAAPASRVYRARKFVHKHRVGFAAGVTVAIAMVAATWVSLWQASIAGRERNAAREAAAQATLARDDANQKRVELEHIVGFQQSLLRGINLGQMGQRLHDDLLTSAAEGMRRAHRTEQEIEQRRAALADLLQDVNLADASRRTLDGTILTRGLSMVQSKFANQPLLKAESLKTIGETMADLGLVDGANAPLEEATNLFESLAGPDSPRTLYARSALAHLRVLQGRLPDAERILRDVHQRAAKAHGDDAAVTLDALTNLGLTLRERMNLAEAELDLTNVLERRRRLDPDGPKTFDALCNLAELQLVKGDFSKAEQSFRIALDTARARFGNSDERTALVLANLGAALRGEDKYEAAASFMREALAGRRATLGNNDLRTLQTLTELGTVLADLGQFEESRTLLHEALDTGRRLLGDSHPRVQFMRYSLGEVLNRAKQWTEAEPLLRRALDGFEAADGANSPMATIARLDLGRALAGLGRYQEAERAFLEAMDAMHGDMSDGTWLVENLVDLYDAWNAAEPGRGHDAQAAECRKRLPPDDASDTTSSQSK